MNAAVGKKLITTRDCLFFVSPRDVEQEIFNGCHPNWKISVHLKNIPSAGGILIKNSRNNSRDHFSKHLLCERDDAIPTLLLI
jgi:hypothetical protein